ncbi:hypothetical protein EV1_029188 [Malus domestica]
MSRPPSITQEICNEPLSSKLNYIRGFQALNLSATTTLLISASAKPSLSAGRSSSSPTLHLLPHQVIVPKSSPMSYSSVPPPMEDFQLDQVPLLGIFRHNGLACHVTR